MSLTPTILSAIGRGDLKLVVDDFRMEGFGLSAGSSMDVIAPHRVQLVGFRLGQPPGDGGPSPADVAGRRGQHFAASYQSTQFDCHRRPSPPVVCIEVEEGHKAEAAREIKRGVRRRA